MVFGLTFGPTFISKVQNLGLIHFISSSVPGYFLIDRSHDSWIGISVCSGEGLGLQGVFL